MPVTRSAAARTKVQKSLENKQDEEQTEEKSEEDMAAFPLPKTVKDISDKEENGNHLKTRTAVLLLVIIFASSTAALAFVYYSFPHLDA